VTAVGRRAAGAGLGHAADAGDGRRDDARHVDVHGPRGVLPDGLQRRISDRLADRSGAARSVRCGRTGTTIAIARRYVCVCVCVRVSLRHSLYLDPHSQFSLRNQRFMNFTILPINLFVAALFVHHIALIESSPLIRSRACRAACIGLVLDATCPHTWQRLLSTRSQRYSHGGDSSGSVILLRVPP
jgi:hypothetical protein